ncbi:MAG: replicative DNA helicase [Planctomycetota bacterium]|nr:MAG: replicative DNA helicase [Planctomycetota bacterium]
MASASYESSGSGRLLPQSLDSERSVLGSMFRSNDVIGDVVQILNVDNFYSDAHQKIYKAMIVLYEAGKPVDLVVLTEALKLANQIDDVGGYGALAELWDAAPTAANAVHYAHIVRDRSIVRSLINVGNEILRDAYDQVGPADELLHQATGKMLDVAERGVTGRVYGMDKMLEETFDRIDQRQTRGGSSISGISSGYPDLDEVTAGFQNSEMIIIAARPSVGKTAFALNLIRNIAVDEKSTVLFCSLEQSRVEIVERLLCSHARVDAQKLRKGLMNAEDMERLIAASGVMRNAKIFIDDSPGQGMLRIAANARRLKLRNDLKMVVIDYLQLIEPENRRDPRQEQVAQISRRLKGLARELSIPVIALAQVNRSSEDRQDHKPRLSDLRESGSIEQDADTVILLHRPERFEPGQHEGLTEVIIGKQRNGPVGEITLTFNKNMMRFENFAVGVPFDN